MPPGVPRNVRIVPGNNQVTMTWEAPASWGTYEAEAYTTGPSHNTAGTFTNPASVTSATFYCTGSGNTAYACNGATETYRIQTRSRQAGSNPPVYLRSAWVEVTVTVGVPAVPTSLSATPGNEKLDLTWTAPAQNGGPITGYDLHYTSAAASTVADSATASGSDPSAAWVNASHSGTTASQTISSLSNGTTYRWRVRAKNTHGAGGWAFGTGRTPSEVSLSASPNPVVEGASVTVTATLSAPGPAATIPVTVSTSGGSNTAEQGDVGTLAGITVAEGATTATAMITTNHDTDTLDETFTVALNTSALPNTHLAGSPSSVQVTIDDDDMPTVSLSVNLSRPTEGESVTVTATLSSPISGAVTIPITLTDVTAESTDHGSLSSISIAAGQTTGTGTITTIHDAGHMDETFTVSLGTLPSEVRQGSPSSVTVTIRDDEGRVRVSLTPTRITVKEGEDFDLGLAFSRPPDDRSGFIPLISEPRCTRGPSRYRFHDLVSGISFGYDGYAHRATKYNIKTRNVSEDTECTIKIDDARLPDGYVAGAGRTATITILDVPDTKDDGDDPPAG